MSKAAAFTDHAGIPDVADAVARTAIDEARRALSGLSRIDPRVLSANGLLQFQADLEGLTRLVDGRHIRTAAEIAARSDRAAGFDGLAARHGCATPAQLIEQVAGVSARTARQRLRVASQTAPRVSETGLPLPELFAATAAGLTDGVIGIDAADAITATLRSLPVTVPVDAVEWAERTLVDNAIGTDAAPPVCADLIRAQAAVFRDRLDADGVEPRDDRLVAKRGLRFFRRADGMLGVDGRLAPAQEAVIVPVFDAFLSPRTAPAFLARDEDAGRAAEKGGDRDVMDDPRTREQQRADIFTALCEGAAKTGQTPQLQGAAPTVLVTVRDEDFTSGVGVGAAAGTDRPLPISAVTQVACDGGTQHVHVGAGGRVLELFSRARFFTSAQRKAMIARDGPTCAKDGCLIPAYWAEAHQVIPDREGGPTEVDNGVLLCWWHHRLVEHGELNVKMVGGRPVFGRPDWYTRRSYLAPHRRE